MILAYVILMHVFIVFIKLMVTGKRDLLFLKLKIKLKLIKYLLKKQNAKKIYKK